MHLWDFSTILSMGYGTQVLRPIGLLFLWKDCHHFYNNGITEKIIFYLKDIKIIICSISHMNIIIFVVKFNLSVRISQIIFVAVLNIWTFFYKYLWFIILFKKSWKVFLYCTSLKLDLHCFQLIGSLHFITLIPLFKVLETFCMVKSSEWYQ